MTESTAPQTSTEAAVARIFISYAREDRAQVEKLTDEQREVFDLLWYEGLTQPEAATILGVSLKTVKRRWQDARLFLFEAMRGEAPE